MSKQSNASRIPVLLTRPMRQSKAFAVKLSERFGDIVRPVIAPLMEPLFLMPELPSGTFSGVIFTSATGVEAVEKLTERLPRRAYCVGRQTTAAAASAGYEVVSASGNAEQLAELILSIRPAGRLLHLSGLDVAGDLAGRLSRAGIPTERAVVYQQTSQPVPPEVTILFQTKGVVIAPVFSPRSARLLQAAIPDNSPASLLVAAMSSAVAEACASLKIEALDLAGQPDGDGMLDSIGRLVLLSRTT